MDQYKKSIYKNIILFSILNIDYKGEKGGEGGYCFTHTNTTVSAAPYNGFATNMVSLLSPQGRILRFPRREGSSSLPLLSHPFFFLFFIVILFFLIIVNGSRLYLL